MVDYNEERQAETGVWKQIDGEYRYIPPQSAERRKRKKQKSGTGALIALVLCFSMLGSIMGAGGVLLWQHVMQDRNTSGKLTIAEPYAQAATHTMPGTDGKTELTAAELYETSVNSTVGITTSITTTNYWGFVSQSAASGSGFLISPDGYILTNYHVIEDSDSVTVTMYDGTSYQAAIRGYDAGNDIAVLKIDAVNLPAVTLGDSESLRVGDDVIAIGNPLGELTFSLTAGKVSALNRAITLSSGSMRNLIQTDCAINSGNSGGALFNMRGEVIGITNAKYSGNRSSSSASIDNIGFAIPVNSVLGIVKDIIENGTKIREETPNYPQNYNNYFYGYGGMGDLFNFFSGMGRF